MDMAPLPGVDVVHDVTKLPLPFTDNSFDTVLCQDIMEHIDYIPVLCDVHRILSAKGTLAIRVPHFTSRNNFIDPTHRHSFSIETFDSFARGTSAHTRREYYFDFYFSAVNKKRITFQHSSRLFFYNRFIEWLVNRNTRMQNIYETTMLARLFPAENIVLELKK